MIEAIRQWWRGLFTVQVHLILIKDGENVYRGYAENCGNALKALRDINKQMNKTWRQRRHAMNMDLDKIFDDLEKKLDEWEPTES